MYIMKKLPSALMMFLALLSGGIQADPGAPEAGVAAIDAQPSQLPPAYPEWPERFRHEDTMPPPPPGPYMSSALSRMDAFPSGGRMRDEFRESMSESPFFRPEMPWPEGRDRPQRWMPEEGEYNFAPDGLEEELEAKMRTHEPPPAPAWRQTYPQRPPMQRPPIRPGYYGYRGY